VTGRDLYTRITQARAAVGGVSQWDGNKSYRFTQPQNDDQGAWSAYDFLPEAEKRLLRRVAAELVTRRGASRVQS